MCGTRNKCDVHGQLTIWTINLVEISDGGWSLGSFIKLGLFWMINMLAKYNVSK